MSDLRTSLPIPTQPWEAAKARFLEGLSEEESKRFKDATLENLFYDASTEQKRHARNSRSWLMQERLSSLIDSFADYGKAMDIYSNTYGLIVCPIWGSLRVVLHIAHETGKFQEKLVEMLAQIGDVLPRFRIYQTLFKDHERLLVALSAAYLDVLRFCVRTKDFFKRAKQSMSKHSTSFHYLDKILGHFALTFPLSIVLKGAWKSFRTSFEESIADFRKHSKIIEKEAKLAHMIESARRHEIELANRALQIRNEKLAKRHRILSLIPSVDYQSKLSRLSNQRHPSTTKWIYQTPQFTSWSISTISDCLCVYGIPGSGKSVLAASVVDVLQENPLSNATSLVCYYFFDYTDVASLEPMRVVGSLIQQLLQALPLDKFDQGFQCPFIDGQPWPSQSICVKFLLQLLDDFKTTWLVLDAVDELALEAQTAVLDTINQLLGLSSTTVKVFITSRGENYLIRKTLKLHNSLKITSKDLDDDITSYIQEQIVNVVMLCNPLLENDQLRQEVIHALATNAKGMFLWVRFQLYSLAEVLVEKELKMVLKNLPKDLYETYARIIQRIDSGPGGEAKLVMMQKLFRWVAVARRPLTLQELQEAAELEKTDTYLHTNRTTADSRQRLISYCGNLLAHNEEDDTVTFAHHTVQQFLYTAPQSSSNQSSLSSIQCGMKFLSQLELSSAHIEIGEICLAYLDFTDFETQIVPKSKGLNLGKVEVEQVVWGRVPFGSTIKGLIAWTQTRSTSKTWDNSKATYTIPDSTRPSHVLAQRYSMLDYIITFWAFHTAHLTPESPTWASFKHIALHRNLSFNHRPWHDQDHQLRVEKVVKDAESSMHMNRRPLRTRNRLLGGAAPEPSFSVGHDMLMYAWGVAHGVGPVLLLVDPEAIFFYLLHIEASCSGSQSWKVFQLKDSPSFQLPSLLSEFDQFVQVCLSSRPYEAPNGFWNEDSIYDHALQNTGQLLGFVTFELSQWIGESDNLLGSMIRQAILCKDDHAGLLRLLYIQNHNWDRLTAILTAVAHHSKAFLYVLDYVLDMKAVEDCPPKVEWQLIFVLYRYFDGIQARLLKGRKDMNDVSVRVILTLLLSTPCRPSFIHRFIRGGPRLYSFQADTLPKINWNEFVFGCEEVYRAVLGVDRSTMIGHAYPISRIVQFHQEMGSTNSGLVRQTIANYLNHTNGHNHTDLRSTVKENFDAKAFEADDIHLLQRVLDTMQVHNTHDIDGNIRMVKDIVPLYWEFVRCKQHKSMITDIIDTLDLVDQRVTNVAVPLLPPSLLRQTLDALEQHRRRDLPSSDDFGWLQDKSIQSGLLEAMIFMRRWTLYMGGYRGSSWHGIVREAFAEWRTKIEMGDDI